MFFSSLSFESIILRQSIDWDNKESKFNLNIEEGREADKSSKIEQTR